MINSTASISRCSVFADMLNAPIAELTVSNYINTVKDFINARALVEYMSQFYTTMDASAGGCF